VKRERAKEKRPIRVTLLLCFWFTSVSLLTAQKTAPALSAPSPVEALVDATKRLGVNFQYRASHTARKYLLETMGAGVALFDYDNDGRLDIYLVNGAPLGNPTPKGTPQKTDSRYWNRLYHQKADGTFEDFSLASEVAVDMDGRTYAAAGVDFADYNNDGWPDMVVTDLANQRYALYQNNGMAPSAMPATPQELAR
jgi:hypothetical protein